MLKNAEYYEDLMKTNYLLKKEKQKNEIRKKHEIALLAIEKEVEKGVASENIHFTATVNLTKIQNEHNACNKEDQYKLFYSKENNNKCSKDLRELKSLLNVEGFVVKILKLEKDIELELYLAI